MRRSERFLADCAEQWLVARSVFNKSNGEDVYWRGVMATIVKVFSFSEMISNYEAEKIIITEANKLETGRRLP